VSPLSQSSITRYSTHLKRPPYPASNVRTDECRRRIIFDGFSGGCRLVEVCLAPKVLMTWGIDTVIPMRAHETQGRGRDRRDCMKQFKAAGSGLPPTRPT